MMTRWRFRSYRMPNYATGCVLYKQCYTWNGDEYVWWYGSRFVSLNFRPDWNFQVARRTYVSVIQIGPLELRWAL